MTAQDNKELIRHIMEDGFNKQDMSVVYDSFHVDYCRHGHGVASMTSLAEHVEDLKARHAAFDDARFTIGKIVADGDTVAVQFDFTGVHSGTFNGLPATGNRVKRPAAAFFVIRDGKVAEGTVFADGAGFMTQLQND
jgi:steroid delta-isomerase-like uncharacterized protein